MIEACPADQRAVSARDLTLHVMPPIVYRAIFAPAPMSPAEIPALLDDAFAAGAACRAAEGERETKASGT